jgi:hypothetical protein
MRLVVITLTFLAAVALVAMFGTIQAMDKASPPAQYRVVLSGSSTNYAICLTWPVPKEFGVSRTGEVVVDVLAIPHGCSLVCLGIKLTDGSARSRKVIEVLQAGRVVRRLSVRELENLPADSSGTRKLDV